MYVCTYVNRFLAVPMTEFLPIILALFSMLLYIHYAKNYAGIINAVLWCILQLAKLSCAVSQQHVSC